MCVECMSEVKCKRMPQFALSNDMFFGYTPHIIYEHDVTIVEMICASVCVANNTQIQLNVYTLILVEGISVSLSTQHRCTRLPTGIAGWTQGCA